MDERSNHGQAVELLQQLGLKEYEAKCFVALARHEQGTAKDISETSEVPRTRVYDAIRVLESKGLVETQHSNPQVFRAVSIEEAVETLESTFLDRTDDLRSALDGLDRVGDGDPQGEAVHEVWSLTGGQGVTSRTRQVIEAATDEILFVIGHPAILTEELADHLRAADQRGVTVIVGTIDAELKADVQAAVPEIDVFVSGLDWLRHSPLPGDDTEIGRLLMADRESILVSSFTETGDAERTDEHAVFGRGFDNGVVAIVRRLMATGLPIGRDPGEHQRLE